jgi:transcription termination factor Rho
MRSTATYPNHPTAAPFARQRSLRTRSWKERKAMTSFKNFRNRARDHRANGDGQTDAARRPADTAASGSGPPSTATELGPEHLEILRQIEAEGEPLSLAEELVELADRGDFEQAAERLETLNKFGETHIAELQRMSMPQLLEEARQAGLSEVSGLKRQDLIFRILKERVKVNGLMFGEGTLEILPDGFGFLRSPDYHYLSCPDDIYV